MANKIGFSDLKKPVAVGLQPSGKADVICAENLPMTNDVDAQTIEEYIGSVLSNAWSVDGDHIKPTTGLKISGDGSLISGVIAAGGWPTNLSGFTNDLGNYGNWLTFYDTINYANYADSAGSAGFAGHADSAVYAECAGAAYSADSAGSANYANTAGSASYASSAGSAPADGGNASSCDNFTGWFQNGNAESSQGFNPNLPWFEIGNAYYTNKTLVQNSGVFVNNGAEVLRGINQDSPIKTGETVVVGDYERVVVLDASSNNIAVSIPSSSGQGVGRVITLKRIDASENTVTITSLTTDGTIDGAVSIALVGQWSKVTLIAFGQGGLDWITI